MMPIPRRRPTRTIARGTAGRIRRSAHRLTVLSTPFFLLGLGPDPVSAQERPGADDTASDGRGIDGRWEGSLTALGQNLEIGVTFDGEVSPLVARIDIPAQGAHGLRLQNVSFERPRVHFELPAGPGLAVWDGLLRGDTIEGEFMQAGVAGTFALSRVPDADDPTGVVRPGRPEDAIPRYRREEVTFENGAIRLAGTLSFPEGSGPHPAVVLISGSGAQNRDEEIFGFQPFRLISEHLNREGIAVLRYDDRGVDGSTGSVADATSADFAADVLAAVELLKEHDAIDVSAIGLLGHSEGGLVAPLAAVRSEDISFLVLLAAPAVPGAEILLRQGELIRRVNGASRAAIERQQAHQRRLFDLLRRDAARDELVAELERMIREGVEAMPARRRQSIHDVDAFVATRIESQLVATTSTWFRYFLDHDPRETLRRTRVPVLALFGQLDLQVPPTQNRGPMAEALSAAGNTDATIEVISGANHLFQAAVTGSPSEYAALEKEFVPGLLDRISGWILARTR
jgi:pimeloyl-ACP methyl ester carboxylesterase